MSTYQLGFIGTGNMGGALAQAAAKSGADMLLSNRTAAKAEALAAKLGCAAGTNLEIAESCSYIFLGVKPQMRTGHSGGTSRKMGRTGPGTAGGTESATFGSEGQICACLHGSGHYD